MNQPPCALSSRTAPHRSALHCNALHRAADICRYSKTGGQQTRTASAGWSTHQTPDPHRCFSDLPTAPQGPFKGPKPRDATHRDFIEPWTGLGPGTGLPPPLGPPMATALGLLASCRLPDCPEKKVRALSLRARLCHQAKLLLLLPTKHRTCR